MTKMYFLLLLFSSIFYYVKALECGIRTMVDNDMKKAVTSCLTKNMTMKDMYDFSNFPSDDDESSPRKTDEDRTSQKNSSSSKEMKNRKARSTVAMKFDRQDSAITTTSQPEVEATTVEIFPQEDNCILQCVLSRLELTNQKGFPEQEKISNILTKKVKGRELIDFLKDTTDNCFQKIKEDSSKNPCDFSIELVRCLADGGKSNCGDWPVGDISLFN